MKILVFSKGFFFGKKNILKRGENSMFHLSKVVNKFLGSIKSDAPFNFPNLTM